MLTTVRCELFFMVQVLLPGHRMTTTSKPCHTETEIIPQISGIIPGNAECLSSCIYLLLHERIISLTSKKLYPVCPQNCKCILCSRMKSLLKVSFCHDIKQCLGVDHPSLHFTSSSSLLMKALMTIHRAVIFSPLTSSQLKPQLGYSAKLYMPALE